MRDAIVLPCEIVVSLPRKPTIDLEFLARDREPKTCLDGEDACLIGREIGLKNQVIGGFVAIHVHQLGKDRPPRIIGDDRIPPLERGHELAQPGQRQGHGFGWPRQPQRIRYADRYTRLRAGTAGLIPAGVGHGGRGSCGGRITMEAATDATGRRRASRHEGECNHRSEGRKTQNGSCHGAHGRHAASS